MKLTNGIDIISVVIPAYNSAKTLPGALESVFAQTYGEHEIIVVDDGSSDDTPDVLSRYASRVKYIRQENKGPSAARNMGIRAARGEYIAFLDADDLWLPEKLELQLDLMKRDPMTALVGCGIYAIDRDGQVVDTVVRREEEPDFPEQIGFWNAFGNPSCALARKSVFEELGPFNENLRFGEDWEMWLRISRRHRVRFVSLPMIKFRKHDGFKNYERIDIIKSCIAEIMAGFPETERRRNRKKVLCRLYKEMAWNYLSRGRRLQSIFFMGKAMLCHPRKLYHHDERAKLLIRALLPAVAMKEMTRIKRRLQTNQDSSDMNGIAFTPEAARQKADKIISKEKVLHD